MKKVQRGITLIELMTVMVIVSILAAVAIPSYTQYIRRSDRAEAKTALLENAQFMERNYTAKNSYAIDGSDDEMTSASLPVTHTPKDSATPKYAITLGDDLSATEYTLIATPVAGSPAADDACGTLSITHTGVKAATGGSVEKCWSK